MPIPKSKDPGKIISFLTKENKKKPAGKKWSKDQIAAIAFDQARKSGAKIPRRKK
ncbi:MAG: hypothetical protein ACFFG0_04385 [Candidatus Thorarchaeota archaeon]